MYGCVWQELDVKAGGGQVMTIGNILKNFLCKLEWFSTLFPRIPVPIQVKYATLGPCTNLFIPL